MFEFRRVVGVALEDFGIRRRRRPAATVPAAFEEQPSMPLGDAPPPCAPQPPRVVWQGAARRRPELQRFCDHLEADKVRALSP